MHYVIFAKDKPGYVQKRLDNYDAHKAYLGSNPINFLVSGPLVDEGDRTTMVGSFFLVEADNLEQVKEFNRNDPFFKAEIWESCSIEPFLLRVNNMTGKE